MTEDLSDFDRGALALSDLKYDLRRQVQDFCTGLWDRWDHKAISWEVDVWGQEMVIALYVDLVVDADRYVLWSFDITHRLEGWWIDRDVELNKIGESGNTIIHFDDVAFASFEQLLPEAPKMLSELFTTRADVERRLAGSPDP